MVKGQPATAAYGGWPSPITPDMLGHAPASLDFPCFIDGLLYWQESRPAENGRSLVVRRDRDGHCRDLLPPPWNARSRVHEYGGLSWLVWDERLFFVHYDDQRIYQLNLTDATAYPVPLTAATGGWRFADFCIDPRRRRLIAVAEQHFPELKEPENKIVAIDMAGGLQTLAAGADFYASPRLSPDYDQLCWLQWNHPNMPWDGTELQLAQFDPEGALVMTRAAAGGANESVFQPAWSPDGVLHFVSDRSGWWNLYRHENGQNIPLCAMAAEFGLPLWNLGMSTYGFLGGEGQSSILCCFSQPEAEHGPWQLALLGRTNRQLRHLEISCTSISAVSASGDQGCFVGARPDRPPAIFTVELTTGEIQPVHRAQLTADTESLQPWFSIPRPVTFPTTSNDRAHGYFYPPRNPEFRGPKDSSPPLIVVCHGGPTGATTTELNYKIQFWTSRGFAVVDVNYRGSTGYGRAYREKLKFNWGISDVADVAAAANYLVQRGEVDPQRLVIRGSSAGGYTVLAALTWNDLFRAGASLYGIGDLEALAKDTHKFESRYLDALIGPYPDALPVYRQRSPLYHVDQLRCPVIVFQGLEDKVVPPDQAVAMVNALTKKGIPVAYVPFPDERHGFKRAGNVSRTYEAELYFYRQILDIASVEELRPVAISNHQVSGPHAPRQDPNHQ